MSAVEGSGRDTIKSTRLPKRPGDVNARACQNVRFEHSTQWRERETRRGITIFHFYCVIHVRELSQDTNLLADAKCHSDIETPIFTTEMRHTGLHNLHQHINAINTHWFIVRFFRLSNQYSLWIFLSTYQRANIYRIHLISNSSLSLFPPLPTPSPIHLFRLWFRFWYVWFGLSLFGRSHLALSREKKRQENKNNQQDKEKDLVRKGSRPRMIWVLERDTRRTLLLIDEQISSEPKKKRRNEECNGGVLLYTYIYLQYICIYIYINTFPYSLFHPLMDELFSNDRKGASQ